MASDYVPGTAITPKIDEVSGTVRVSFPFERDTASAVFRRGDTLWMLFDTATPIMQPRESEALASIATAFTVVAAGDTQIVRVDLATDRLATLASEGRSWVLSIGDVLLNATEPHGAASQPRRRWAFRDVGDAGQAQQGAQFPRSDRRRHAGRGDGVSAGARDSARSDYVDFDALRTVQGW